MGRQSEGSAGGRQASWRGSDSELTAVLLRHLKKKDITRAQTVCSSKRQTHNILVERKNKNVFFNSTSKTKAVRRPLTLSVTACIPLVQDSVDYPAERDYKAADPDKLAKLEGLVLDLKALNSKLSFRFKQLQSCVEAVFERRIAFGAQNKSSFSKQCRKPFFQNIFETINTQQKAVG